MDFSTIGKISLNIGEKISYSFKFPIAASATGVGTLPYGTTIDSAEVEVYTQDNTSVTSLIVDSTSITSDTISILFDVDSSLEYDRYKIIFSLTLDNGYVVKSSFNSLYIEEL
jgi:hypothetical protein